jgi:hypothetical protein
MGEMITCCRGFWAIPAKTENLKITLREEILRNLYKYRWMKKLEIRKSREKSRV